MTPDVRLTASQWRAALQADGLITVQQAEWDRLLDVLEKARAACMEIQATTIVADTMQRLDQEIEALRLRRAEAIGRLMPPLAGAISRYDLKVTLPAGRAALAAHAQRPDSGEA